MKLCLVDFETASSADLKVIGAHRYAEDIMTEILCLAFSTTAEEVPDVWTPDMGPDHPVTKRLRALVDDPEVTFVAHNAGFEKAIYRNIMVALWGWPDIPNSRWHDTMAVCAMKAVPQKLEDAAKALHLSVQKDMEGSRLTIGLSRINKKTGMFPPRTPEIMGRVYTYCKKDVTDEWEILRRVGWFQPGERNVWLLDQRINERGAQLDLHYVGQARKIVDAATIPLAAEFREITGFNFGQRDKIMGWLRAEGANLPDMRKETLEAILGSEIDAGDENDEALLEESWAAELPPHVLRALRIRQLVGSASIKKLGRMERCVGADGRARGLLQYHGAGPGRWAGRLLQPQNFPRGTLKLDGEAPDPELVVQAILTGDPEYVQMLIGPPVETVVSGLRHAIIAAPGRLLCAGDFAQVEARVLLALAGQYDKCALLAAGNDVYVDMAQQIYKRPIDKKKDPAERQTGKNSVLGLGFQMGGPKFLLRYGNGQSLEFCKEVVRVYREDWAPNVPKVWYGLERAAVRTVHEGTPHEAFGVTYALENGWLTARLPSGRKLYYFEPRAVKKAMPWDPLDIRPAFEYKAQKMGRWITVEAFGGLLTENVVQALARDLLVAAMFKAEANGFPISLTVHDEIVSEPLEKDADWKILHQIMTDIPDWARAMRIPIAAEGWVGSRYKK